MRGDPRSDLAAPESIVIDCIPWACHDERQLMSGDHQMHPFRLDIQKPGDVFPSEQLLTRAARRVRYRTNSMITSRPAKNMKGAYTHQLRAIKTTTAADRTAKCLREVSRCNGARRFPTQSLSLLTFLAYQLLNIRRRGGLCPSRPTRVRRPARRGIIMARAKREPDFAPFIRRGLGPGRRSHTGRTARCLPVAVSSSRPAASRAARQRSRTPAGSRRPSAGT